MICLFSVESIKTDYLTAKDHRQLIEEFDDRFGKSVNPNLPDMGPIMDSLIMTSGLPDINTSSLRHVIHPFQMTDHILTVQPQHQ